MKPGSTDGILTVLASILVTAVLFIAQHFTGAPRPSQGALPDDNLAEASASAQSDRSWGNQSTNDRTASSSGLGKPADPFDTPFGQQTSAGNRAPGYPPAAPNRLPPIQTRSDGTRTFGSSAAPRTDAASSENQSRTTKSEPSDQAAETFKVVSIIDGDTVDVLVNRQPLRLRLSGIDTPEKGQPFGNAAKDALSKAIGGQYVQYVVRDTDRYNRSIADIYFRGVHVNKWLVQKGLAWHYKAYSNDQELAQAEQEASAASRGLWADPRRIAPWNWRKLSKVDRDQYR